MAADPDRIDLPVGRSAGKRRAIMDAATALFLRDGYLSTSMDDIAALAAVSKQTVYKQFTGKEQLFAQIVTAAVNQASDRVYDEVKNLPATGDLERDLRDVARRLLKEVMQPKLLSLRRLVIGEASRFPELGQTFYDLGPGRTIVALGEAFKQLAADGKLQLADAMLAAQHFNWLVVSIPLNRAMLLADDTTLTTAKLRRFADAGVAVFLAAHAP
jgi:TetR/AcrR family transcriptional regulator, mexJK operon transcriptional repressor